MFLRGQKAQDSVGKKQQRDEEEDEEHGHEPLDSKPNPTMLTVDC
jgi:hypothetical protein